MPTWRFRRRAVFGAMVFGGLVVTYAAVRWEDAGLGETLALGGFGLIGTVVAAYIGGAVYEDTRTRKQEESNVE